MMHPPSARSLAATWVWLKWTVARNGLSQHLQRDGLERTSRWFDLLLPLLMSLVLLPIAGALGVLALFGGSRMFEGGETMDATTITLRILLAGLTIAMILAAPIRSSGGAEIDMRRWLLLPVSQTTLHRREVLSALTDPWLLGTVPALLLLPLGVALSGRPGQALMLLAGSVLVIGCLALIGTTTSSLVTLLFRRRRRGEIVSLILILVLSTAGFVPQFFAGEDLMTGNDEQVEREFARVVEVLDEYPLWTQVFPSEIYSRAVAGTAAGEVGEALAGIAALTVYFALLCWASRRSYAKLLLTPETGASARGAALGQPWAFRFPGLSPQVEALAHAWVRSWARTLRGKMAWIIPPLFLVLMNFLWVGLLDRVPAAITIDRGPILAQAGIVLTLLTLQPMLFNQFAVDGPGLSAIFTQPVTAKQVLRAKQVALALMAVPPVLVVLVLGAVLGGGGAPLSWLGVLLNFGVVFVALNIVGTALSILVPRKSDLNAMGSAANPHGMAGLAGTMATFLLFAPGAALVAVRWPGFGGWAPAAVLLVWLALVFLGGRQLETFAAGLLEERKENLLQLSRR